MINCHSEFNLSEISIGNHNFPENARLYHPDEGLHFPEIGMERIWNNIVDTIRSLMVEHQKVSIDANEVLSKRSLLSPADYLLPVLLADQVNEPLGLVSCQEILP